MINTNTTVLNKNVYHFPVRVESGKCFNASQPYTCDDIARVVRAETGGDVTRCKQEVCIGNVCTDFEPVMTSQQCRIDKTGWFCKILLKKLFIYYN